MAHKPDWGALGALFQPPPTADVPAPGPDSDLVMYRGEAVPRWLARDLVQERAAIFEYDVGMSRADAEALARRGLRHESP
ncbi:MAG: hypothetical protein ACEPO2_13565 [Pelagibaca sp.]